MKQTKWNQLNSVIELKSHTDLDGHGSEIVLKGMGFNPNVTNLENTDVDHHINQYVSDLLEGTIPVPDILVITDISPLEETAKKVDELYRSGKCEVYLFDHHKTALALNDYEWAKVVVTENEIKECGTNLLYRFLTEEAGVSLNDKAMESVIAKIVEEIRLYDTWDWESQNHTTAKQMNDLLYLIGPKPFIEQRLTKIANGDLTLFSPDEELLLHVEDKRIKKYLHDKNKEMVIVSDFFTDEEGNPLIAGVVQADNYQSELGHHLCDKHPEIDFTMMLKVTRNTVSMRAVKEHVDLSPIAKKYGGGGHPHAAGCTLSLIGMEFIQKVFEHVHDKTQNK